jgi:hypothetical protein
MKKKLDHIIVNQKGASNKLAKNLIGKLTNDPKLILIKIVQTK